MDYREHTMVRFQNGTPTAVWYSQHDYGQAYTYEAVQKVGKRPIAFSAKGSHANYPRAGKHDLHVQGISPPSILLLILIHYFLYRAQNSGQNSV